MDRTCNGWYTLVAEDGAKSAVYGTAQAVLQHMVQLGTPAELWNTDTYLGWFDGVQLEPADDECSCS